MPPVPKLTWQQILARGGAMLIHTLLTLGRSVGEIATIIRNLFGNPTQQSIQAAIDRVQLAEIAGDTAMNNPPEFTVPNRIIPITPGMVAIIPGESDPLYRYYIVIPFTGPGGQQEEFRTIVIDSREPLTLARVQQEALSQWIEQITSNRRSPRAGETEALQPGAPTVTMIFRQDV